MAFIINEDYSQNYSFWADSHQKKLCYNLLRMPLNEKNAKKRKEKPCKLNIQFSLQGKKAGDERIELPPKVLETPIIPFDQSPVSVFRTTLFLYHTLSRVSIINILKTRVVS